MDIYLFSKQQGKYRLPVLIFSYRLMSDTTPRWVGQMEQLFSDPTSDLKVF